MVLALLFAKPFWLKHEMLDLWLLVVGKPYLAGATWRTSLELLAEAEAAQPAAVTLVTHLGAAAVVGVATALTAAVTTTRARHHQLARWRNSQQG